MVTSKARGREAIGFCIPVGDVTQALERMDRLDRPDRARLERSTTSRRWRAACIRSAVSAWSADQYVAAMQSAMSQGGTANAGIQAAAAANRERLAVWGAAFTGAMGAEMNAVGNNLELPAQLCGDLGELRNLTRKMQDHLDRPQGTSQSFSAEVAIMKNQFNVCVGRLGATGDQVRRLNLNSSR